MTHKKANHKGQRRTEFASDDDASQHCRFKNAVKFKCIEDCPMAVEDVKVAEKCSVKTSMH